MLKRIAFKVAMVAILLSPAAIAQAGYPDNNKPSIQTNANGAGGIPLEVDAYNCTTSCYYNTCYTNCW